MSKHEELPGGEHITTWGNTAPLPSYEREKAEELGLADTLNWRTGGCKAHFRRPKDLNIPVGVRVAALESVHQNPQLAIACQYFSDVCKKCLFGKNDQTSSVPCAPYEDGAFVLEGMLSKEKLEEAKRNKKEV